MRNYIFLLGLSLSSFVLSPLCAQESEFYKKPVTPKEFWRATQFEISVGKYDLAAQHIKGLLDSKPSDKDWLEIEAKDGLAAFLRLRNVETWSKEKKSDAEARENVETLIKTISGALKNELSNPERIAKFAKNLIESPEESAFALKELVRSGVDAIPILIGLLRTDQPADLRAAILDALPHFDSSVVPPLVASLEVNDINLRLELLDSLRKRSDYLSFPSKVETDLIPTLWYFSADLPANPVLMRKKAREMLLGLLDRDPDADRNAEHRLPQWRLVQFARIFLEHKARFATPTNALIWKWDGAKPVASTVSISDAEEYYGLRYARWALDIQADYAEAQKIFIAIALDKHFARAGSDTSLAKSAPNLYAVLATAPLDLVTDALEAALLEHRVPLAVSLIQVLGDRDEVKAARPSECSTEPGKKVELRPSLLMRALDYPDRRVQFAAVDAILKMPGTPTHQRSSQIIKILTGYLLADPPEGESKPKAMIGDYDNVRGQSLAVIVRKAGFQVEIARTGKELMRRLQEKADVDLVLLDQHLPLPALPELLAQMRADFRTRVVPLIVVASPDKPTTAHPITLLARLASLVAAEEHLDHYKDFLKDFDPTREAPSYRFKKRLEALQKLVRSAGIVLSPDVEDRLEYLVYLTAPPNEMGFPVEKPILEKSRLILPALDRANRLTAIFNNPKRGHVDANEPPFADARELTGALSNVVSRLELGLPQEVLDIAQIYWNVMQAGQVDATGKFVQKPLPSASIHYPEIEARLNRLTKSYRRVRVIPEVFTDFAFKEELQDFVVLEDPKILEGEKKTNAKAALEWLRKMAVGELPGYPVADAELALRLSLQKPELAALAIDAVGRLASREAQQDLANVVLGGMAPEIRIKAIDALIHHIQLRGRMLSPPQLQLLLEKARTEEIPDVKARLLAVKGILNPDAKETGALLRAYVPPPPTAPKEEGKEEKKEAPKNP